MLLIPLAIVLAVLSHLLIRSFLAAVIVSTLTAAVSFQLIVWMQLGHRDPFWPIAFVTTSGVSALLSVVVGGVIRLAKRYVEH